MTTEENEVLQNSIANSGSEFQPRLGWQAMVRRRILLENTPAAYKPKIQFSHAIATLSTAAFVFILFLYVHERTSLENDKARAYEMAQKQKLRTREHVDKILFHMEEEVAHIEALIEVSARATNQQEWTQALAERKKAQAKLLAMKIELKTYRFGNRRVIEEEKTK